MKLQLFNGGASNRLAPQLINVNQGVVYENIDNAQGILAPVKDKTITDIAVERYQKYFNAENIWVSSSTLTDYLEFQQVMYSTDRATKPQKLKNGVSNNLGIEAPTVAPGIVGSLVARPVTDLTTLNRTDVGDLSDSDFDYLAFNVSTGGEVYSTPFAFTVFASSTTNTRAQGELRDFDKILEDDDIVFRNSITTSPDAANRAVDISRFQGNIAGEIRIYRSYEGVWRLVGTATLSSDVITDDTLDISGNSALDDSLISPFNGTYQYLYTFYNSNDGTESAPSPLSSELSTKSGRIALNLLEVSTDPQTTHKRIYRVGGSVTQFTLVEEIDNTVTEYTDGIADSNLEGTLLVSDNYQPAPEGLKFLTEAYAILFGVIGTELRFTPIGVPNAWPPEFSIQFDQDITGLGPVANGLLVFTRSKTYIVTGTGPTTLAQQSLRGDQGCIAFESIAEAYEGTLIWASEDGLCTSSGNEVRSLTKNTLGKVILDPVSSTVNDEVYYCHNADGTTLAWDYRFEAIPKWLNLDIEAVNTALGVLYGYKSGFLYTLFSSADNLSFNYKSPRFIEGSFTESKTYKKFFIRSEGTVNINVLIDDTLVATFNLTTTETFQEQVPQSLQRGYSVQFEITGNGVMQELEYVVGDRKNG